MERARSAERAGGHQSQSEKIAACSCASASNSARTIVGLQGASLLLPLTRVSLLGVELFAAAPLPGGDHVCRARVRRTLRRIASIQARKSEPNVGACVRYGGTAPGHDLSFAQAGPVAEYWVIHPDYVTLEAAGAPPSTTGDCAPALQRVLAYASKVQQTSLKLGPRDYVLNSLSSVSLPNANTGLSIIGRGQTVSRLLVPVTDNTDGAFAVTFGDGTSQFLYKDFSVLATSAIGVNTGCGTAILTNFVMEGSTVPGVPPEKKHGGVVENVYVGTDGQKSGDDPPTQIAYSFFSIGMDLSGTPRPFVFNSLFSGCTGPGQENNFANDSPRYAVKAHLVLNECYDPQVKSCGLWHATTGITYSGGEEGSFSENVQGFTVIDTHIEGVLTGIFHDHGYESGDPDTVTNNPGGKIAGTSVQFRDRGFNINNIVKWQFGQNDFRNEGPSPNSDEVVTSYDMLFRAANLVTLVQNSFYIAANPDRVNIYVDAATSHNGSAQAMNFLIDGHQFGDRSVTLDPDNAYFATSAIQISNYAENIQIGASNQFVGLYNDSIVDDPHGNALTSVGYPSTNAAPFVIPPGDPTLGQPTLGNASTNGVWPASFSHRHYLPGFTGSLTSPGSGWVIFTDPASNNLVAQYLGNAPQVIVVHP
jgi:hypothetical protein